MRNLVILDDGTRCSTWIENIIPSAIKLGYRVVLPFVPVDKNGKPLNTEKYKTMGIVFGPVLKEKNWVDYTNNLGELKKHPEWDQDQRATYIQNAATPIVQEILASRVSLRNKRKELLKGELNSPGTETAKLGQYLIEESVVIIGDWLEPLQTNKDSIENAKTRLKLVRLINPHSTVLRACWARDPQDVLLGNYDGLLPHRTLELDNEGNNIPPPAFRDAVFCNVARENVEWGTKVLNEIIGQAKINAENKRSHGVRAF